MLEIKNLSCGYEDKTILKDVSFSASPGDIVCMLGSNGAGKSTLIKTMIGLINPHGGEILLDGENIKDWSWSERGRSISYIPQTFNSMFHYRVIDIILMGRTSYLKFSASPSKEDEKVAIDAMKKLKIFHLKDKIYSRLSGGERQLVKISQALAQQSKIIVMDEPTNNLDFGNQTVMLKHLERCAKWGLTIIMATHYPEHALYYGSKALLVKDGSVVEINQPGINLTEEDLKGLYGVDVKIIEYPINNDIIKTCLPVY